MFNKLYILLNALLIQDFIFYIVTFTYLFYYSILLLSAFLVVVRSYIPIRGQFN